LPIGRSGSTGSRSNEGLRYKLRALRAYFERQRKLGLFSPPPKSNCRSSKSGQRRRCLRGAQHSTRKHPHQIDRQILANSFDVLRRCIREQNSDLIHHLAEILVLIEQHDNDLGVKLAD
jgi:hypothetical protein